MFKQLCLLPRKPGMPMDEFKAYYETTDAKIAGPLMPQALRYQRRFVQPEKNPMTGEPVQVPFDCLMELWWKSRADFEAAMASLGEGNAFTALYEDEEKVFASHDNPVFSVEEHESAMRGYQDPPSIGALRQADGLSGVMKQLFLLNGR